MEREDESIEGFGEWAYRWAYNTFDAETDAALYRDSVEDYVCKVADGVKMETAQASSASEPSRSGAGAAQGRSQTPPAGSSRATDSSGNPMFEGTDGINDDQATVSRKFGLGSLDEGRFRRNWIC